VPVDDVQANTIERSIAARIPADVLAAEPDTKPYIRSLLQYYRSDYIQVDRRYRGTIPIADATRTEACAERLPALEFLRNPGTIQSSSGSYPPSFIIAIQPLSLGDPLYSSHALPSTLLNRRDRG